MEWKIYNIEQSDYTFKFDPVSKKHGNSPKYCKYLFWKVRVEMPYGTEVSGDSINRIFEEECQEFFEKIGIERIYTFDEPHFPKDETRVTSLLQGSIVLNYSFRLNLANGEGNWYVNMVCNKFPELPPEVLPEKKKRNDRKEKRRKKEENVPQPQQEDIPYDYYFGADFAMDFEEN